MRRADLNGDGRDDYVWIDPKTGAATLYVNGGFTSSGVTWLPWGVVASGIGDGAGVVFADIDGDGLDNYLWISESRIVTAYKNAGPGSGGAGAAPWIWIPLGVIADGLPGIRGEIQFADIDRDRPAEYLFVGPTGAVTAYLNPGVGDKPIWQPMEEIASGTGDRVGVHLVDLLNDGRTDYIWLDTEGKMTA